MKNKNPKYTIGYDPAIEGGDEGAVCIDFQNAIFVAYQTIREHIYPYLEQGITNITPINCNDVIAKKVQEIVKEWTKNNN